MTVSVASLGPLLPITCFANVAPDATDKPATCVLNPARSSVPLLPEAPKETVVVEGSALPEPRAKTPDTMFVPPP